MITIPIWLFILFIVLSVIGGIVVILVLLAFVMWIIPEIKLRFIIHKKKRAN